MSRTLHATPYDFELTASHGHTYPQPPTQLVPVHQEDVKRQIPGVGSTGLDDGPYLPGKAPRKKPEPKSRDEMAAIRAKAWATRRAREASK